MKRWWLAFLLWGCGRAPELAPAAAPGAANPSPGATVAAPAVRAPTPEVRATLVPLETLGAYRVDIEWSSLAGQSEFWVERRYGLEKRIIAHVEGTFSFRDLDAWPGQTYAYTVQSREDEVGSELGTTEVRIPVDKTFAAGVHAWDFEARYGRLRLDKGAILRTGERDLELELFDLISDGGRIETWPEGSMAAAEGAAGGRIAIRTRAARGSIELISRGQGGAPGAAGVPGAPGLPGASGLIARYAIDPFFAAQRLGAGNLKEFWKVEAAAVAPGVGADGGAGGDGRDGWRGGNSGGVSVEVATAGPFLPTFVSEGGKGGAGGLGGKGGPGGAGGLWTGNDGGIPAESRPVYLPPAAGKPGAAGQNGKAGVPGEAGPVCFRVAGQRVRGCD